MTLSPVTIFLIGAVSLLGIGLLGLLTRRNLIQIIIAVQIMAKAAVFALVLAGKASGQINLGQSLAVTVIVADTIVTVIGLALAVQVRRRFGTLDVKALSTLRG
jgi:NADH:ubiquinone oxidoreductase subunit K